MRVEERIHASKEGNSIAGLLDISRIALCRSGEDVCRVGEQ